MHLDKVFVQLGIDEQLKPKKKPQTVSSAMGVVNGEADVAVGLSPQIILTQGVDFAGHLPREVQLYLVCTGGVSAASRDKDAARALIRYLTAPESASVLKTKGWEPAQ